MTSTRKLFHSSREDVVPDLDSMLESSPKTPEQATIAAKPSLSVKIESVSKNLSCLGLLQSFNWRAKTIKFTAAFKAEKAIALLNEMKLTRDERDVVGRITVLAMPVDASTTTTGIFYIEAVNLLHFTGMLITVEVELVNKTDGEKREVFNQDDKQ